MSLNACQENEFEKQAEEVEGTFTANIPHEYMFDISARGKAYGNRVHSAQGNMHILVEESDWNDIPMSQSRASVNDDDAFWTDKPLVAMFITDTNNNPCIKDVPLNPYNNTVYDKYDIKGNGTPYNIDGSGFFWNTWEKKAEMPSSANFYGYYPRPCDWTDWNYTRNSVIDYDDARGTNQSLKWYQFRYSFFEDQTDENLSMFDLMYSIPEEANSEASNRHGNKNKNEKSNIQMPFKHAFCLLNFEISRDAKYTGDCCITSLRIVGTQVHTSGILNIMEGEITPDDSYGKENKLSKTFSATNITSESPFKTAMIAHPTTDIPDTDTSNNNRRLVVECTIDGAEYSCSLPNISLEGGKKYSLKLTVAPAGTVIFRVWEGASVKVNTSTSDISSGEHEITYKGETFTVTPLPGYKISQVLKNGKVYTPVDGKYTLERNEGNNTYYNIVTCPTDEWYQDPEYLRIQFDGKWNDKYSSKNVQNVNTNFWSDLTGHNNDGTLLSFNNTKTSGWNDNGLSFDGEDDIVTFPGNVSSTDYTVEMYIYINSDQSKIYPRLLAEDSNNNTGYPSFCLNHLEESRISICGNGTIDHNLIYPSEVKPMGKLCQLDFVFNAENKQIKVYMNGEYKAISSVRSVSSSIPTASIGNRIMDNTRALKGTYYSFLLYDKALSEEEINQNYSVNQARFK